MIGSVAAAMGRSPATGLRTALGLARHWAACPEAVAARIVDLRGYSHGGEQAPGKQNLNDDAAYWPPSLGWNRCRRTMLLRRAPNCHAPGELPPKPAATTRAGAGQRKGMRIGL